MSNDKQKKVGFFKWIATEYWNAVETISGKKAADLAANSIDAYSHGRFIEGAQLGAQSNFEAIKKITSTVSDAAVSATSGLTDNHRVWTKSLEESTKQKTTEFVRS